MTPSVCDSRQTRVDTQMKPLSSRRCLKSFETKLHPRLLLQRGKNFKQVLRLRIAGGADYLIRLLGGWFVISERVVGAPDGASRGGGSRFVGDPSLRLKNGSVRDDASVGMTLALG